jgi:hypothetical protein
MYTAAKAAFAEDETLVSPSQSISAVTRVGQTHLGDDSWPAAALATSASRFWKCQRGTLRCLPLAGALDSLQYVAGSAVASARAAAVISESI